MRLQHLGHAQVALGVVRLTGINPQHAAMIIDIARRTQQHFACAQSQQQRHQRRQRHHVVVLVVQSQRRLGKAARFIDAQLRLAGAHLACRLHAFERTLFDVALLDGPVKEALGQAQVEALCRSRDHGPRLFAGPLGGFQIQVGGSAWRQDCDVLVNVRTQKYPQARHLLDAGALQAATGVDAVVRVLV